MSSLEESHARIVRLEEELRTQNAWLTAIIRAYIREDDERRGTDRFVALLPDGSRSGHATLDEAVEAWSQAVAEQARNG